MPWLRRRPSIPAPRRPAARRPRRGRTSAPSSWTRGQGCSSPTTKARCPAACPSASTTRTATSTSGPTPAPESATSSPPTKGCIHARRGRRGLMCAAATVPHPPRTGPDWTQAGYVLHENENFQGSPVRDSVRRRTSRPRAGGGRHWRECGFPW